MEQVLFVLLSLASFAVLMEIRNRITYKHQIRRINEISQVAQRMIDQGKPWRHLYDTFNKRSYNSYVWDLTVWTYDQFYPEPIVPLSTLKNIDFDASNGD